jgi:cell division protein FtsN
VRKFFSILAVSFLISMPLIADPLVARAHQREKAGDTEGAAHLYGAWLQANQGAPGEARVFARYFRLENDYHALRDASLGLLATGHGLPGAADQFAAIARLFEIGGLAGEARDAYLRAYSEGAGDSTLVSAFFLSLQMHDSDAMAKCLAPLESRGVSSARLLRALADVQAGHGEAGGAVLSGLADNLADPDAALKARWVMYAAAAAAQDQKGQADARARLAADFPGAPETALLSSPRTGTVVLFPSPDVFITGDSRPDSLPLEAARLAQPPAPPTTIPAQAAPEPTPTSVPAAPAQTTPAPQSTGPAQTAPAPQTSEPSRVSVQAGSFQVKENADDLTAELSKRGFSPIQKIDTVQGRERYRVFAGVGLDQSQARALLAKLFQQGFSGLLVIEK